MALSPSEALLRGRAARSQDASRGVENDLNALFLLLGGVSLLVGALGIANVTLVSVLERIGEIGLRVERRRRAGTSPRSFSWKARRWGCWAGSWGPASARWWL